MNKFKNWLRKKLRAFLGIESEIDINKIANELYKMQKSALRKTGIK